MRYDQDLESTTDRLHAMLKQQSYYFDECYEYLMLPKQSSLREWRQRICEWYYSVIDHAQHDRSVAALSINLLDRYVMIKFGASIVNRREYYLVAMTCLAIGSKLSITRITRRCHISFEFLLGDGNRKFTVGEMEAMECDILMQLKWRFHPPIVSEFVCELFELIPRWENDLDWRQHAFEHALYAVELNVVADDPSKTPAIFAYVCILSALRSKPIPRIYGNIFYRNVSLVLNLTPEVVVDKVNNVRRLMRNALQATQA
mmetsp:Transcript_27621/g.40781  ORF Transcript_27621/g.40781 Transcript_27621/m.40781 type:complete len:259 (-) Transcript_27621:116-892(-)